MECFTQTKVMSLTSTAAPFSISKMQTTQLLIGAKLSSTSLISGVIWKGASSMLATTPIKLTTPPAYKSPLWARMRILPLYLSSSFCIWTPPSSMGFARIMKSYLPTRPKTIHLLFVQYFATHVTLTLATNATHRIINVSPRTFQLASLLNAPPDSTLTKPPDSAVNAL